MARSDGLKDHLGSTQPPGLESLVAGTSDRQDSTVAQYEFVAGALVDQEAHGLVHVGDVGLMDTGETGGQKSLQAIERLAVEVRAAIAFYQLGVRGVLRYKGKVPSRDRVSAQTRRKCGQCGLQHGFHRPPHCRGLDTTHRPFPAARNLIVRRPPGRFDSKRLERTVRHGVTPSDAGDQLINSTIGADHDRKTKRQSDGYHRR